eukprot:1156892-Pelagomonas_calceolata.AAC.7
MHFVVIRKQNALCGAWAAGCTPWCSESKMHFVVIRKQNALCGAWAAGCTLWCSESRMQPAIL